MGNLHYGAQRLSIEMDDHLLIHLQAVCWPGGPGPNPTPGAVWIHSGSELHFEFGSTPTDRLDRHLLEQLTIASVHARGIDIADVLLEPFGVDTIST